MERSRFLTFLCMLAFYGRHASASVTQEDILQKMEWVRENSVPAVVPVHGEPVNVTLRLSLTAIREVDASRGEVEILAMRSHSWRNPSLSWEHQRSRDGDTGGEESLVHSVSMDIKHLWTPDIVAYNHVHAPELLSPPLASVAADGTIWYVPNERIRFRCDLEHFETVEGSNCTVKYSSWTYNGWLVGLNADERQVSLWDYQEDPRFDLLATYAESETKYYPCCDEPYPSVTFTLNIRKKVVNNSIFGWKK